MSAAAEVYVHVSENVSAKTTEIIAKEIKLALNLPRECELIQ
jgi:hypothetical protein